MRFLDFVAGARAHHPGMHIYHYAPVRDDPPARDGRALRGARGRGRHPAARRRLRRPLPDRAARAPGRVPRSYSIKKLEPLYMGDELRTSDVQHGDESIVRYVEARALARTGDDAGARRILDDIADYNRYDCVSTLRLRDWLRERAAENGIVAAADPEAEGAGYAPSVRAVALLRRAEAPRRGRARRRMPPPTSARCAWPQRRSTTTRARRSRSGRRTSCGCGSPVTVWEHTRDVVAVDRHAGGRRRLAPPRAGAHGSPAAAAARRARPGHAAQGRHRPVRVYDSPPPSRRGVTAVDPRRPPRAG